MPFGTKNTMGHYLATAASTGGVASAVIDKAKLFIT